MQRNSINKIPTVSILYISNGGPVSKYGEGVLYILVYNLKHTQSYFDIIDNTTHHNQLGNKKRKPELTGPSPFTK